MDFRFSSAKLSVAIACCLLILSSSPVLGNDPDPLQDYCVADFSNEHHVFLNGLPCKNPSLVTPADFKSSLLRDAGNTSASPLGIAVSFAYGSSFGGLNTQGLSVARIDYAYRGLVPPHIHPRATEVLFVLKGKLSAGFVDTNNKLFAETLSPGDLYVFPRGLVHYTLNVGQTAAVSLSALNSQNPGFSLLELALFGPTPPIPDAVLLKTFNLSAKELRELKKMHG